MKRFAVDAQQDPQKKLEKLFLSSEFCLSKCLALVSHSLVPYADYFGSHSRNIISLIALIIKFMNTLVDCKGPIFHEISRMENVIGGISRMKAEADVISPEVLTNWIYIYIYIAVTCYSSTYQDSNRNNNLHRTFPISIHHLVPALFTEPATTQSKEAAPSQKSREHVIESYGYW